MSGIIIKNNRPLIIYMHPRDIDIHQPKIKYSFLNGVRHYINISKTEKKLFNITKDFSFKSFEEVLSDVAFLESLKH